MVLETQYMNLYYGLFLSRHGFPVDVAVNTVRSCPVPPLKVVQAVNMASGTVSVTSPPPHLLNKVIPGSPTPTGEATVCLVSLDDLAKKEVLIIDGANKQNEFTGLVIKDKSETNEPEEVAGEDDQNVNQSEEVKKE